MVFGKPYREKNSIKHFTMTGEVVDFNGMDSGYLKILSIWYTYLNSKHGKPRSPRMGIYTYLNVFPPKRSLSSCAQSEPSICWNGSERKALRAHGGERSKTQ